MDSGIPINDIGKIKYQASVRRDFKPAASLDRDAAALDVTDKFGHSGIEDLPLMGKPAVGGVKKETVGQAAGGEQVKNAEKNLADIPGIDPILLKPKKWAVLYYMNGSCDLEYELNSELNGAGLKGTDENVAVGGQISYLSKDGGAVRKAFGRPIKIDRKHEKPNEILIEDLGKTNMGQEKTLEDFLRWGMKSFPAEHYMVVFGGHGGSFMGMLPDKVHDDHLDHSEIKTAFDNVTKEMGKKIDVVQMDNCYMACAEAAHALKDSANYLIASEETAFGHNTSHYEVVGKMQYYGKDKDLEVGKVNSIVMESQHNYTAASVLRLWKMPEFCKTLKNFSEKLVNTQTAPEIIKKAFSQAQHYGQETVLKQSSTAMPRKPYQEVRDVYSLAGKISESSEIKDEELKKAAVEVESQMDELLAGGLIRDKYYEVLRDSHGMTIYAPTKDAQEHLEEYEKLEFAKETGWGEVVKKFGSSKRLE